MDEFVIVPTQGGRRVVLLGDSGMRVLPEGPAALSPVHASERGDLVFRSQDRKLLSVRRFEGETFVERSRFVLPRGLRAMEVAVVGEVLLVALYADRKTDGPRMLGYYRLDQPAARLEGIEVPPEVLRTGKHIDAFLLDGSKVIAVDNIVLPKWLFELDASVVPPVTTRVAEISVGAVPYDTIVSASLGATALCTYSVSDWLITVELIARDTLRPFGVVRCQNPNPRSRMPRRHHEPASTRFAPRCATMAAEALWMACTNGEMAYLPVLDVPRDVPREAVPAYAESARMLRTEDGAPCLWVGGTRTRPGVLGLFDGVREPDLRWVDPPTD